MRYFKRELNEGGREEMKLVGAQVPANVFYYLNLFCLVDERSKSSLIRPMIEDWADAAIEKIPEKELIKLAADLGYKKWTTRKRKGSAFPNVLKIQERELRSKGVSEAAIVKIIERIASNKRRDDSKKKIERVIKKRKKIKAEYEKSSKTTEE